MLNTLINKLYKPYQESINEIARKGYVLNKTAPYSYKCFYMGQGLHSPNQETREYLDQYVLEFAPVVEERALIHSWLLRVSNRLYYTYGYVSILPVALVEVTLPQAPSEHDRKILDKAKEDPEYSLVRRRLLLKTMM
jgi:hypothetical protein